MPNREKTLRRHPDDLAGAELTREAVDSLQRARQGGGSAMPSTLQRSMGEQFGADLSGVKVHTSQLADQLAEGVAATAFTVGSDIFFRQGAYASGSGRGQHLLAHEVAHVVGDHSRSSGAATTVGAANAPEEIQAEQEAHRVVAGLRAGTGPAQAKSAHTIHRMADCGCSATMLRRDDDDDVGAVSAPLMSRHRRGQVVTSGLPAFKGSMAAPAVNSLQDNIPSNGMGRFDAQYLVDTGDLIITVRPRFTFTGTWSKSKKDSFVSNFVKQAQSKWSGKHEFECTKTGFESLRANVTVLVEPVDDPAGRAHFECTIQEQKTGDTYIGRQQYNDLKANPGTANPAMAQGMFAGADAKERAHDNLSTRCTLALHDLQRIEGFLAEFMPSKDDRNRSVITGVGNGISATDTAALQRLVRVLNHSAELGATPVPIILTYHESDKATSGKKRAEAVATILRTINNNPIKLVAAKDELKQLKKAHVAAQSEHAKDTKAQKTPPRGYKAGGRYAGEAQANITQRETDLASTNVTIHADQAWAMKYKASDPYSILAHEFGHMLGNPDEYFGYGTQLLALKKAELLATGNEADTSTANRLTASSLATGDTDDIQGGWGQMVQRSGAKIPTMTTKGNNATNSMMNAGAIVLPAHYATLWEALGRITAKATPPVAEADWKFS